MVFALRAYSSLKCQEQRRVEERGVSRWQQTTCYFCKLLVAMLFEAVTCSPSTVISILSYFSFLCLETDLEQASSKLLCLSGRCTNGEPLGLLLPCSWFGKWNMRLCIQWGRDQLMEGEWVKVQAKKYKNEPVKSEVKQKRLRERGKPQQISLEEICMQFRPRVCLLAAFAIVSLLAQVFRKRQLPRPSLQEPVKEMELALPTFAHPGLKQPSGLL